MPDWIIPGSAPCKVGVLLFDQFSNYCLANMLEPLRAANRFLGRPAYVWQVLTMDGAEVRSSSALPVTPEARLSGAAGGDILFLLPSYDYRRAATPGALRALRGAAARYGVIAGLDTGSWLMAEAGLLDGRPATIHFDEFDRFAERFPDVDAKRERWIIDGDRITAGGAATSFELVMALIGQAHGTALALEVAALFMQGPAQTPAPAPDRKLARAVAAMEGRIEDPLTIPQLAREAGCSQRELERRCRLAYGAAPRALYRRIRLNLGKRLMQDSPMSVAEAALRCGYADPSAFARAFKREFGRTPLQMRG
jgi:transcriptional regulator GlxA family with amidase domain